MTTPVAATLDSLYRTLATTRADINSIPECLNTIDKILKAQNQESNDKISQIKDCIAEINNSIDAAIENNNTQELIDFPEHKINQENIQKIIDYKNNLKLTDRLLPALQRKIDYILQISWDDLLLQNRKLATQWKETLDHIKNIAITLGNLTRALTYINDLLSVILQIVT